MLEVELGDEVLDAPFPWGRPDAVKAGPGHWSTLRGDGSCGQSVSLLLRSMEGDLPVTVERLARSGGISDRALQRLLTAEGTNVRQLIDEMRWEVTLEALPGGPLGSVARDLGYSAQSSLSRAVRRWTGRSPRAIRSDGSGREQA